MSSNLRFAGPDKTIKSLASTGQTGTSVTDNALGIFYFQNLEDSGKRWPLVRSTWPGVKIKLSTIM
jgi:hypothetical protein